MPSFAVYKSTGEVVSRGTMATDEFCLKQAGPGEFVYIGEVPAGHFFYGGFIVPLPQKPSDFHTFSWVTHQWVDPRGIDDIASEVKARITDKRWRVETGGLTLQSGVRLKTAKEDQDRINGLLFNLQTSGVATIDFKADSGWVTMTADEVGGIAQAVALHVQSCFSMERVHHEAVDALGSRDELLAYDFSVGWGG